MRCAATVLCAVVLTAGLARAQDAGETPTEETPKGLEYEVAFAGDFDSGLRGLMRDASRLVALNDNPPLSEPALHQRATGDRERFMTVLESEGYYEGDVSVRIDDNGGKRVVRIAVEPGPRYRIGSWSVEGLTDEQREAIRRPEPLPVSEGAAARAPDVLATEAMLVRRLKEEGYPFARAAQADIRIDRDEETLAVTYRLQPGEKARFGDLSIEGLETVEESYLRLLAPWGAGDEFDQRVLESFRQRLAGTGLFRSIRVTTADSLAGEGRLPVSVAVEEGNHRSLIAGANFSSDEGFGIELGWEHRNLFGEQERFAANLRTTQLRQQLSFDLRIPNYQRYDKDLLLNLTARQQDTDAFYEQSIAALAALERKLNEHWRYSYGLSAEFAQIEEDDETDTFMLFGGPLTARRDSTDDLLDPTKGSRLSLGLTPYFGTFTRDVTFGVAEVAGSSYFATPIERLVLAGRIRLGSIFGEPTGEVPASKRLYAGGGGSVRGYEFQSLGPLDSTSDPVGVRSVLEIGFEPRIGLTESIGLVPFIEGGNVYDDPLPDRVSELRWAAGLGLRYFTPVGPLRFDVAVPLDKRPTDDNYQIYISIGQAF
ncbi:MAG: autotransporter assembly complex family protein [Acetobacterales bacterium]